MRDSLHVAFTATEVAVNSERFTDDYTVIGMYFADEHDEENWNFTKAICDEEIQRVCTVKEIQQFVLDGGIESFVLTRNSIHCVFLDNVIGATRGIKSVLIKFDISDDRYSELLAMAMRVFENEKCFVLV